MKNFSNYIVSGVLAIAVIVLFILHFTSGKSGKGINSFKKGLNDIEEDIKADPSDNKTTGDK
jgi:sec-independent protein translocase protein TatA